MADRTPSGCRRKHPGPVVRPVADSRNVHFFFQNCPAEKTRGGRRAGMKAALLAVAIGAQVSAGFVPAPARCGLLVVAPRADAACIPGRARALDDRVGARRSASADRFRHALHMSGTTQRRQASGRRRRQMSSTSVTAAPTGVLGKMTALCVAAVKWVLLLLREIYGQFFVLFMDTLIQKPFLFVLNKVQIENHKQLTDLISKRGRGTPLITVSNHCSSLDEPLLFSALVPWPMKQWQLRWSLCNDDMFFKLGPVFAQLFFAAARGLPIYRGRSIDQPTFREFCSKARDGGWCHIFPEGRIWQPWKLQKEARRLGPLRPGVGKLIAHCEREDPVVIPFYHTGMHRVLPQVPNSRAQAFPPKTGNTLRVRVGQPIPVGDLLAEYRERRQQARAAEGITDTWTTTAADEELYDKLTERVEAALLALSSQVDPEKEWQTHPAVLPGGEYFAQKKHAS